jgi:hypothetical protein
MPVSAPYNQGMKFDIIITHIGNPKAKNIIARHLAHDPSISLQKAMSMLENPPVVYMTGIMKDDAQYHVRQLEKIQVSAKLVEVQLAPLLPHAAAPSMPEHAASTTAPPSKPAQPSLPLPHPAAGNVHSAGNAPVAENAGPAEGITRNRIVVISSVSAALLAIVIVILALNGTFDWNHAFALDWSKAGLVSPDGVKKNPADKKAKRERGKADSSVTKNNFADQGGQDSSGETTEVSDEEKGRAEACVDSGKNASDITQAISFYQLAIAFNKRNVNAWYALHDAFVAAQMSKDAEKTDAMMRHLFGDNIFSIARIMEPFGTVKSTSLTRDGIYRVEYQARESDPARNLADSYLLVKALKTSCLCSALSLYARTSAGKGMLVYIRTESFPSSFDEYKASANITYLK